MNYIFRTMYENAEFPFDDYSQDSEGSNSQGPGEIGNAQCSKIADFKSYGHIIVELFVKAID